MSSLQLFGSVGPDQENEPDDVVNVGSTLVGLGLPGAQRATETGAWDNHFDDSVRIFQENSGLDVDGILLPGGPTQSAINQSLEGPRRADSNVPSSSRSDVLSPARGERASTFSDRGEADWADGLLVSPRDRSARRENPFSIARREFGNDRGEDDWWRGDSELPQIRDRAGAAREERYEQRPAEATDPWTALIQPSNARTRNQVSPLRAMPPVSAEQESEVLTANGYRYVPDPMGRVGWGDWVDPQGKVLDPAERQDIVRSDRAPGGVEAAAPADFRIPPESGDNFALEVIRNTRPEYFDDPQLYLEALEAALEDGAIPAAGDGRELIELFGHLIIAQRGFGAKTLRRPGSLHGRNTYPPELARRLEIVAHDSTRVGIYQAIKGSVPEKTRVNPEAAFVVNKIGHEGNMVADFYTAVRISGGSRSDIKPADQPGVRIYKAPDNTRFIMRRTSRGKFPTNEFHIEPPTGGEVTKIKIRYTSTPE